MNLDYAKTMLQETGKCTATGMTVREIMEVVTDLGLDPNTVLVQSTRSALFGVDLEVEPTRSSESER